MKIVDEVRLDVQGEGKLILQILCRCIREDLHKGVQVFGIAFVIYSYLELKNYSHNRREQYE